MKNKLLIFGLLFLIGLIFISSANAINYYNITYDNFNDNNINYSLWTPSQSTPYYKEINQRAELNHDSGQPSSGTTSLIFNQTELQNNINYNNLYGFSVYISDVWIDGNGDGHAYPIKIYLRNKDNHSNDLMLEFYNDTINNYYLQDFQKGDTLFFTFEENGTLSYRRNNLNSQILKESNISKNNTYFEFFVWSKYKHLFIDDVKILYYNITENKPFLNLEWQNKLPLNNTIIGNNPIIFYYNVSGYPNETNVSLYINGSLNQTQTNVSLNTINNFSVNMPNGIEGYYNFTIKATNSNLTNSSTKIIYVDYVEPVIYIGNEVPNGIPLEDNSSVFNSDVPIYAKITNHYLTSVYWFITNETDNVIYQNQNTSVDNPIYYINDTINKSVFNHDGTYKLTIHAIDNASNEIIRNVTLDIDTTPPNITTTFINNSNFTEGETIIISGAIYDDHSITTLINNSNFINFGDNTNYEYRKTAEYGNHSIKIISYDIVNNTAEIILNYQVTKSTNNNIENNNNLGIKNILNETGSGLAEFFNKSIKLGKLIFILAIISVVIVLMMMIVNIIKIIMNNYK